MYLLSFLTLSSQQLLCLVSGTLKAQSALIGQLTQLYYDWSTALPAPVGNGGRYLTLPLNRKGRLNRFKRCNCHCPRSTLASVVKQFAAKAARLSLSHQMFPVLTVRVSPLSPLFNSPPCLL